MYFGREYQKGELIGEAEEGAIIIGEADEGVRD